VDGGHTHGRRCRREVAGLAIMNYSRSLVTLAVLIQRPDW
jgi:hypothetical protein